MKKIVLIIGILSFIFHFSLFIFNSSAQDWKWLNPFPTGNSLNDVKFLNADTGWAVGNFGTVVSTIDGGKTWSLQKSGTNIHLNSLCFANSNTLYAVGGSGLSSQDSCIIIKSTNSGLSWFSTFKFAGFGDIFISVNFPDANIGYVVSSLNGIILKTTDSGNNWIRVSKIDPPGNISAAYFSDTNNGFVVGDYGWILKTTDGGYNWNVLNTPVLYGTYNDEVELLSIFFPDSVTGYIVGFDVDDDFGIFLKSTESGNNWTIQYKDPDNNSTSIYFTDSITGYGTGTSGLYKTTDGGKSWVIQDTNNAGNSIYFVDANIGYSVGSYVINKTINAGNNWISQYKTITFQNLHSLFATDSNTLYIVGDSGIIIKTTNGGINWIKQNSGTTSYLWSVCFVDNNTGYVSGNEQGIILKTTDAGKNWITLITNDSLFYWHLFFTSVDTGFVTSNYTNGACKILKTTNGGQSWISIFNEPNTFYIDAIYFINSRVGFAAGSLLHEGLFLRTTDGGNNWIQQSSANNSVFTSIYFSDLNTGYLLGDSVYKTTNGGANWITQNIGINDEKLYSIYFLDKNNGYIIGTEEYPYRTIIHKTTDGGINWVKQVITNYQGGLSVLFYNSNIGYACGAAGTILKTSEGGSIFTGVNKPVVQNSMFNAQCYPNPVNSCLIISYKLLEKSFVNISIYNITGSKIETTIDKTQDKGEYKINFNTEKLNSGVYVIKYFTDNSIRVKKFVKE